MYITDQPIERLFEKAEDYSKTTLELLQLKAISKSAEVLSALVAQMALILAIALASLIINIGLALWIGVLLHNTYAGFFIVGGFYLLVAIALYFFKNVWIKTPIKQSIIALMFKQKLT